LYETLQLVLLRLGLGRGVEEIDGERLFVCDVSIVSIIKHNVMDTDHDVLLVWEKPFCLRRPTNFLCAKERNERRCFPRVVVYPNTKLEFIRRY